MDEPIVEMTMGESYIVYEGLKVRGECFIFNCYGNPYLTNKPTSIGFRQQAGASQPTLSHAIQRALHS